MKKRVFSGIRATGRLHLGNYLGAVKGMLELQNNPKYETLYMVVDIHTITTPYDKKTLAQNKREIIIDYLAAGLDPEKSIITYQSLVPQHTELSFYFSTVITVARMLHLPTYKDKIKQHSQSVTMALLNYPVLMAADILLYKGQLVPAGIDQEPHMEVAREVARKMNQLYGTTFFEPTRLKTQGEYIPSLKGEGKMSKSVEGSYINLTDDYETIKQKIAKIPTDSGMKTLDKKTGPVHLEGPMFGVMPFVKIFLGKEKMKYYQQQYISTGIKYAGLKAELAEAIYKELKPFQEKRKKIESNQKYVDQVIADGAKKARLIAQETIKEVKEKMGLT